MSEGRLRQLLHRLRDERGSALVLASAVMMVLTIAGISVLEYSRANETSSRRYTKTQQAFNVAEAGIANAVGILKNPANTITNSSLLPASTSTTPITYSFDTSGMNGTAKVWGDLQYNCTTCTLKRGAWHVKSVGSVTFSQQGVHQTVARTVRVDVPFTWAPTQPLTAQAWKYIYAKNTSGSTYNATNCNESVYNNINITASMYVVGNLCMQQGSEVSGTSTGPAVDLIVKGWMEMDGNTGVGFMPNGKAATHPNTVQLGLGCGGPFNQNSTYTPTIVNGVQKCQTPSYQIAPAGILPTTTVPAPTADFFSWWTYADPGPNFPCQSPTGSPPMWDNNTSFDMTSSTQGSITIANQPATNGIVDLTPSTADYDCKGSDGVSEIKWTRSSKTLYVNGTFYIDGSGTISATPVQYTGDGTVYVSGTFLIKNAIVCAYLVSAKTGCDTSAWLTTSNPPILMIAANGFSSGGSTATCPCNQTAANDSIEIKSSWFQGGLYGTKQIEIDTSSNMQGPMVSGTEIISQSAGAPFPHFPTVPTGTPGNGISSYVVETPKYYSGG